MESVLVRIHGKERSVGPGPKIEVGQIIRLHRLTVLVNNFPKLHACNTAYIHFVLAIELLWYDYIWYVVHLLGAK